MVVSGCLSGLGADSGKPDPEVSEELADGHGGGQVEDLPWWLCPPGRGWPRSGAGRGLAGHS